MEEGVIKQKSSNNKTAIIIVFVIILLLICCAVPSLVYFFGKDKLNNLNSIPSIQSIVNDISKSQEVDKTITTINNNYTNSNSQTEQTVQISGLNEVATTGDLRIKVISTKNLGSSVDSSWGDPITTDGTFIRIDTEIENIGKDSQYLGDLQITDSTNRQFDESFNRYSVIENGALFYNKFSPNVKTNYSTIFEVAKDAKGLKLRTNGFDFLSKNYVEINLGIDAK
jgi:hypothetical protein